MTKRDFFRLVIKVFGLYNLIAILFYFIPQFSTYYIEGYSLSTFLVLLGSVLLMIASLFVLLFNADFIIAILKLDKNFDEDQIIIGNLSSYSIILLSISIISLMLIVNPIPELIFQIVNLFKNEISHRTLGNTPIDYYLIITQVLSIVVGYLLLVNNKKIAKSLDKN
ncbi:hypothetical protein [Flavobacterium sp.]|uniref:hypothetical protein n=2 Tax=Flavobacterium sp. TaxID=239 RepID=UPI0040478E81